MQNYRFYAVINYANEKKIFANVRDYMDYKHRNCSAVNTKGTDSRQEAQEWLEQSSYRWMDSYGPVEWAHTEPVLTARLPDHADVYICVKKAASGDYVLAWALTSPQFSDIFQNCTRIPAAQIDKDKDPYWDFVLRLVRMAYDNGLLDVTVHATGRMRAGLINGTNMGHKDVTLGPLYHMTYLRQERGMTIRAVHEPLDQEDTPPMLTELQHQVLEELGDDGKHTV